VSPTARLPGRIADGYERMKNDGERQKILLKASILATFKPMTIARRHGGHYGFIG
jgi:hypothetical protein